MSLNDFEKQRISVKEALVSSGACDRDAEIFADCLVTADEYGVTSHGTAILPSHIDRINRGGYNLSPQFKIITETPSLAVIDGDNAIGPVSADFCMKYCVEKARENGMFTVFSRNNNTFGPAFYYPLKAAESGMIGFVSSNSPAQMAPIGGIEKMLGTNPFSMVIPVPGGEPIIVDMATSAVAKSKFKEYKEAGKELPIGWALDSEGNPTTNPDEAIKGLVLPMAGYKGYAISMLIDIIAGALSGAAFLNGVGRFYSEDSKSMNVGYFMTAINPDIVFGDGYGKMINEYVFAIRGSKAAEGQAVSLPGDDRINYRKNREA